MKEQINVNRLFVFLFSAALIAGCSSTRYTTSSRMNPPLAMVDGGYQVGAADQANQSNIMVYPNSDRPSNLSLNDLMRKLPGVRILYDRGPYSRIKVTGMASSFIANTDPLFVVNGHPIGSDYSRVYALVNPNHVISMSVLKGSDATLYGSRGGNGVIVIRTR